MNFEKQQRDSQELLLSRSDFDWDEIGLIEAEIASIKSKDPSTKVGACIMGPDRSIVGKGFNGFPSGVIDYKCRYTERQLKYKLVAHAERNALDLCKIRPEGCTLYVNMPIVCNECAKSIIQNGIERVVVNKNGIFGSGPSNKWNIEMLMTKQMFLEANVDFVQYDFKIRVKVERL